MSDHVLSSYNRQDIKRMIEAPRDDRFFVWKYSSIDGNQLIENVISISEKEIRLFLLNFIEDKNIVSLLQKSQKDSIINNKRLIDPAYGDFREKVEKMFPEHGHIIGMSLMSVAYYMIEEN